MGIAIAIIGCVAVISFAVSIITYDSVKGNKEEEVSSPLNEDLHSSLKEAIEGINYYKSESIKWYQAYNSEQKQHKETRVKFEAELKEVKQEIKTLKQIVDKMDGRVIERDQNFNVVGIKRVK